VQNSVRAIIKRHTNKKEIASLWISSDTQLEELGGMKVLMNLLQTQLFSHSSKHQPHTNWRRRSQISSRGNQSQLDPADD
jgi:hypothetical protein